MHCTVHVHVMTIKQTIHKNANDAEDINLNYYKQNRQPAIHGANCSLQSMSTYGAQSQYLSLSMPVCYPMRYRTPR